MLLHSLHHKECLGVIEKNFFFQPVASRQHVWMQEQVSGSREHCCNAFRALNVELVVWNGMPSAVTVHSQNVELVGMVMHWVKWNKSVFVPIGKGRRGDRKEKLCPPNLLSGACEHTALLAIAVHPDKMATWQHWSLNNWVLLLLCLHSKLFFLLLLQ